MDNALATTCHLTPRQWALLAPELRTDDGWIWLPPNPASIGPEHVAAILNMHPQVEAALDDIVRLSVVGGDASHVATDEQQRRLSQLHSHPTPVEQPTTKAS